MPVLLGAIALVGCSGSDPFEGTDDGALLTGGDTLVVALPFDPGRIDPVDPALGISATIAEMVQPGLVRRHLQHGEVVFEPMLGAITEETGDSATYTLPAGLVWQDGTPLTAGDAAFTWKQRGARTAFGSDALAISALEAKDDLTVTVHAPQPVRAALLHAAASRGIVSRESPEEPLASGSFHVERWDPDDMLVLAANPKAPANLSPHLDRVVFDVVPSYEARLDGLLRGNLDLVMGIEVHDVHRIRSGDGVKLIREPGAVVHYVGYDLTDPRFADVRVRKALTMATDRERMIRELFTKDGQTYATYAIGTVSPALEGWMAREVLPLQRDPATAMDLLARAGWGDSNRDGVRDKGGRDFTFSLLVQSGSGTMDKMAELLVAWWESIGVNARIEHVEATEMVERVAQKDFDAVLWGYPADPRVDPGAVWRTGAPQNWFGYSSKDVDRVIDEYLVTADPIEAQKRVREIQALVHADQPVTFLVWVDQLAAISSRFEGVEPDLFSLFHGIEGWSVPAGKQRWVEVTPDPRLAPPAVRN